MKIITYGDLKIILLIYENLDTGMSGLLEKKGYLLGEGKIKSTAMLGDGEFLDFLKNSGINFSYFEYKGAIVPFLENADNCQEINIPEMVVSLQPTYEELLNFEKGEYNYAIGKYIENLPSIYSKVFDYNNKVLSKIPNKTLPQKSPTDKLLIAMPYYKSIINSDFEIAKFNFFDPVPRDLTSKYFRNKLAKYSEIITENDITGYEENNLLPIQENEKEMFEGLCFIIDCALQDFAKKNNISFEQAKEDGIKTEEVSNFFFNLCLIALTKTRPHTGKIYIYPEFLGSSEDTDEDNESFDLIDDSQGGKSKDEFAGIVYVNLEDPADAYGANYGDILKGFVDLSDSPYAWAEAFIKLLRWGTRKPRRLSLDGMKENILLDLENLKIEKTSRMNMEEFKDEQGNNRFPTNIVYANTANYDYEKKKGFISDKIYDKIYSNVGEFTTPLGLICDVIYKSEEDEESSQRFIDFYTVVESLMKDSSNVRIKGINLVNGEIEVKPELEEYFETSKQLGLKTVLDYSKWLSLIEKGVVKLDLSMKERELVLIYNKLTISEQSFINFSKFLWEDTYNDYSKISQYCDFNTKDEMLNRFSEVPNIGKIIMIKIMKEMGFDDLCILWADSDSLKDLLNRTYLLIKSGKNREVIPPVSQLPKSTSFEKSSKKDVVSPIIKDNKVVGFLKTIMPFKVFTVAEEGLVDGKANNVSFEDFATIISKYKQASSQGTITKSRYDFEESKINNIFELAGVKKEKIKVKSIIHNSRIIGYIKTSIPYMVFLPIDCDIVETSEGSMEKEEVLSFARNFVEIKSKQPSKLIEYDIDDNKFRAIISEILKK